MRWTTHGESTIYASDWVGVSTVDVELPDGERIDHHVVRVPRPAVGTVVVDAERGVLLLYRHRFITDTWGWEIPAGGVDAGEALADAAARELREETGWAVTSPPAPIGTWHPSNGLSDQTFHAFVAHDVHHAGPPTDPAESERIEWVPADRVARLIADGDVSDGLSLTALLLALHHGHLGPHPTFGSGSASGSRSG